MCLCQPAVDARLAAWSKVFSRMVCARSESLSYDKPRLRMIARCAPRMIERGVSRAPKVCGLGHVSLDRKVRRVSGLMPERSRKGCLQSLSALMVIGAAWQCMWSHMFLVPTCGRCSERVDLRPLDIWSHRLGTRVVG